jgi:hypothetical protein
MIGTNNMQPSEGVVSLSPESGGTVSCPICSTEFEGRLNKKTCSVACRKKLYRQGAAYKNNLQNKVVRRAARKWMHQRRRRTFAPAVSMVARKPKPTEITALLSGHSLRESDLTTAVWVGVKGGVPHKVPRELSSLKEAVEHLRNRGIYEVETRNKKTGEVSTVPVRLEHDDF